MVARGRLPFEANMTMSSTATLRRAHDPRPQHLRGRPRPLAGGQGRLHAHPRGRLRRHLGRELLVPEDERVGEPAAFEVRAALRPRSPLPPPHHGPRGRVQPFQHRQNRRQPRKVRRPRQHRSPRPARGLRPSLGDLDARPGRTHPPRGPPLRHRQRREDPRHGRDIGTLQAGKLAASSSSTAIP